MAMSDLSHKLRSFLQIAGVLGILIGTQVTLVGLWNFVIPLLIAVAILATSWVCCLQSMSSRLHATKLLQLSMANPKLKDNDRATPK